MTRTKKDEKRELRKFGLTLGIALALLGGLFWWRDKGVYPYLLGGGSLLILLGWLRPLVLRPFHKGWMGLALGMGWVVTRLILGLLFFVVVTPIGVLARLCGRDKLDRGFDRKHDHYWIQRSEARPEKEAYERQY
jgi:hypothetical protein